jgi:hypothetical protein
MPLDAVEREIVADLIGAVRTLAGQVLTLHLQLGAVRTLLAYKGTISEPELSAVLKELEGSSAVDEVLNRDAPSVDEAFDGLLSRLERTG